MSRIHPYLTNGRQSEQSIWEIATTVVGESEAMHPVGTRGALPDGRVYYYARNSAASAIVAGQLLMAEVQTAQFTELAVATGVIGDTTVTVTTGSTAITMNEYAEGYLVVIDDTGEGITYQIESCPAIGATTAGVITLHDPLQTAITNAATTVQLLKNPWADLVKATGGQTVVPAGISNVAVPAGNTVPQYFWCQTWGVCSAQSDDVINVGKPITLGTAAGQIEDKDGAGEPEIGINFWTSVDTEYPPVFLKIAP